MSVWLFVLGVAVSVFGSIVGLGGGFILVPLMRLAFGLPPAIVAGTSLALVLTNNATASIAYLRQKRIDVPTGLLIAAGGLPGSLLGAYLVKRMPFHVFDWLLALLTLAVGIDMLVRGRVQVSSSHHIVKASWLFAPLLGVIVGLLSGLFGAGGGIVLLSLLYYFTTLSTHEVTATAQFSIVFIAAFGLAIHYFQDDLRLAYAGPLLLGAVIGGPIGARISLHLKPSRLVSLVGLSLIVAACALVARALEP